MAAAETAGERVRQVADGIGDRGLDGMQGVLEYQPLKQFGLGFSLGHLAAAVALLLAASLLSMLVQRALRRYGDRHAKANQAALFTVSRLVHYAMLAIGVLLALDQVGLSPSRLTVFAGALGVGLGFGLQAIFSNFVSGLILLFDGSLKVGDFVELDGDIRGTVRSIDIRSTRVTTNDNIDVLVPNSEFMTKRVVNWTYGSVNRRIRVPFGVAYGTDKELVKKAALEAAERVPFTLATEGDRRPQVWLVDFADSSVNYLLVVWLNEAASRRNTAVMAAYLWELDTALKAHGIEIPFPQRDLNLRSLFGLQGAVALKAMRGEIDIADVQPAAAEELEAAERERLAGNDAQADAEREIREGEARMAADRQQASHAPNRRG